MVYSRTSEDYMIELLENRGGSKLSKVRDDSDEGMKVLALSSV